MKKTVTKILDILEWMLVVILFLIFLMYVFHRATPATEYAGEITNERNEQIRSSIVWKRDYSKRIEAQIIYELNRLPENILEGWLDLDSHIIVYPNEKGSLDDVCEGGYTIAYNDITAKNCTIQSSDIYILGSAYIIGQSLLHEIGHYVYYQYFGINTSYVLPHYEEDRERFVENERDGQTYYLLSEEYFAEMFAYTVVHGTDENYKDTYKIDEIIQNFLP